MAHAAETQRLVVGLVRGVHGLRGAVRVEVLTDQPGRFAKSSVLHLEGSGAPLTVAWSQPDERGILVRFRELPDRDGAETLRDRYLEADVQRDALPDEAAYWHEVEGALVITTGGEELGAVAEIFRAGGSEVYVVRGGPRGELYVPAVKAIVTEFTPRSGRIVVNAEALGLEEVRARRPRGRKTTRALKAASVNDSAAGPLEGESPDGTSDSNQAPVS